MFVKLKKPIVGILAVIGVLAIIGGGLVLYGAFVTDYNWTADELFEEVNKYRTEQGLQELELHPRLCDNLVARHKNVKEGKQHEGFEEWAVQEGLAEEFGILGELYVRDASTAQWAVRETWAGSPGHRTTLEMESMKYGCAYANDGTAVLVVAEEKVEQ